MPKTIDWTPDPRRPNKVTGGMSYIVANMGSVPTDGGWYRSPFPFSKRTKAAHQAVRKLRLRYPSFEFKTQGSAPFDWVWIRRKQDDELAGEG